MADEVLGVTHLLHTKQPSHLRALLDKLGNIEGEILDRLIDLNIPTTPFIIDRIGTAL